MSKAKTVRECGGGGWDPRLDCKGRAAHNQPETNGKPMPGSHIWLVDCNGHVYTLFTKNKYLQCVRKSDTTKAKQFKRISATQYCVWGLSCYHQIYVYVYPLEVPIRVQEITYENERWTPINGFSGRNLLPADRYHWSNDIGNGSFPKESFQLPSEYWQWEGGWYVDENFKGHVTDRGGWQYAANFPANWTPEMRWNSCVRKRKWVRFRRYTAVDKWAKIPDLSTDREPFIDIAVGGFDIPSQPLGHVCVWAITSKGNVYIRTGVTRDCPEGKSWQVIPTGTKGVINISVGPTGMVWAVTWDGQAIVRMGVSRDCLYGTHCVGVSAPSAASKLMQVAVGTNAVWALSRDGQVWFRKGIKGKEIESSLDAVTGTTWIEMVGEMSFIAVGPNDQVFSIGQNNEIVYYRSVITPDELSGKRWQPLRMSRQRQDRFCSDSDSISSGLAGYGFSNCLETDDHSTSEGSVGPGLLSGTPQLKDVEAVLESPFRYDLTVSKLSPPVMTKENSFSHSGQLTGCVTHALMQNEEEKSSDITCDQNTTNPLKSLYDCTGDCFVDSLKTITGEDLAISDDRCGCKHRPTKDSQEKPTNDYEENNVCQSCTNEIDAESELENKTLTENCLDSSDGILNFVTDIIDEDEETERESNFEERKQPGFSDLNFSNHFKDCGEREKKKMDSTVFLAGDPSDRDFLHNYYTENEMAFSSCNDNQARLSFTSLDEDPISYCDNNMAEGEDIFCGVADSLSWRWLSAMACVIDKPSEVPWLQNTAGSFCRSESGKSHKPKLASLLRANILKKLQVRNSREVHQFEYLEHAVEKTSWIKKDTFQWLVNPQRSKWTNCLVEFEQKLNTPAEAVLNLHYALKKNCLHIEIPAEKILCTCRVADQNNQSLLAIHTAADAGWTSPILLSAAVDSKANEWLSTIYGATVKQRFFKTGIMTNAVWSTTVRGDLFVHQAEDLKTASCTGKKWTPVGGHLQIIETNPAGITWGIGYNHSTWLYTGGFGGDIFKGSEGISFSVFPQRDEQIVYVYENQKWTPVSGYSDRGFMAEGHDWSDRSGRYKQTKENTALPSGQWQWIADWALDYSVPGEVDHEGWQYSNDFHRPFHKRKGWTDTVRRRRWFRKCKIVTQGPWVEVGPMRLLDISIQVDQSPTSLEPAAIWAVGSNEDVLCRLGATKLNPRGDAWVHIPTDQPFRAITVGGSFRVWALAQDGSAWFRSRVSVLNPTGSCWIHVVPPPPDGHLLHQISAGKTTVWALDTTGSLWYREDITPTFPEGTCWVKVASKVRRISVNSQDQVWIVADAGFEKSCHGYGTVFQRTGVTEDCPRGMGWEYIIGGDWHYVTINGYIQEEKQTESS